MTEVTGTSNARPLETLGILPGPVGTQSLGGLSRGDSASVPEKTRAQASNPDGAGLSAPHVEVPALCAQVSVFGPSGSVRPQPVPSGSPC